VCRRAAIRGALVAGLAAALLTSPAAAAPLELRARFDVRGWDVRDGLPQASVTGLAQDADGFLWLATFGGVGRFDGVSFDTWDLRSAPALRTNRFTAIYQDPDGVTWLGTDGAGVARAVGTHLEALRLSRELDTATVYYFEEADDGGLWVGTELAVYHIDHALRHGLAGGRVTSVVRARHVSALHRGPSGRLWATWDHAIRCVSGGCKGVEPVRALETTTEVIRGAFLDTEEDGLWIAATGGLWHAADGDPASATLVVPATASDAPYYASLVIDHERRRLWYGAGRALWLLDLDAPDLAVSVETDTFGARHDSTIRALLLDREGSLWIGTDGAGLVRLRDLDVTLRGVEHGLPAGPANLVAQDGAGRLWVSLPYRGVYVGDGDRFERLTDPLAPDLVTALAVAPDGAAWLGAGTTILHHVDGRLAHVADVAPTHDHVTAIHRDAGGLWIGTYRGLLRLDGDGADVTPAAVRAFSDEHVHCLTADRRGGVWAGLADGVLHVAADGTTRRFGAEDGLPGGVVRDILVDDDGSALVGTYGGGLAWLRRSDPRASRVHGLLDPTVSRILRDAKDVVWLNGNAGVSRVPLAALRRAAAGDESAPLEVSLFGIEGNGGTQAAGWVATDGTVWMPTIEGLAMIHGGAARAHEHTTTVTIRSVTVDGATHALTAERGRAAASLELPPGRRDLSVRFTAPSFVRAHQLRYQYRLVGYSDGWSPLQADRVASWSNLPPGDFTFEVRARTSCGALSAPAAIALSFEPSLTERAWFRPLLVLLGLAVFYLAMRRRLRYLHAHRVALERENAERRRAEAEARAEQQRYRALFEGTREAVLVLGGDGGVREGNYAAAALLGISRTALLGARLADYLTEPAAEQLAETLAEVGTGGEVPPVELDLRRASGDTRRVRAVAIPLVDQDGVQFLLTVVDLTRERRLEEERIELSRRASQRDHLESIGRLASGVAHDVNNQLSAIGACAEYIVHTTEGEAASAGRDIIESVQRTSSLTRRLVVFARSEPGKPSLFEADAALESLYGMLTRLLPRGTDLELDDEEPAGWVELDPALFEHAVVNLVVNARDATPEGGVITITTGRRPVRAEEAARHDVPPGVFAWVRVTDDGTGMDRETRSQAFEPFFSTKPEGEGTGLGLYTVASTVGDAGGFVTVGTEMGVGTQITLYFPARAASGGPLEVDEEPLARPTAVVCDDHELVRTTAARMLEQRGFEVHAVSHGEDGLEAVAQLGERLDVLVTDDVMPQMSGAELAVRARSLRPDLPVVLMAGDGAPRSDAAVDAVVTKPFDADRLFDSVVRARARRTT